MQIISCAYQNNLCLNKQSNAFGLHAILVFEEICVNFINRIST